ncbi:serine/threonine-protein kinase Nek7-like [Branchiostoma floridae]|uniref:Serine/threonine-protein kinase Nek7-like n=1 Tax=Branchiostoma floridae TaxID=7739 RepID=A0A9J7MI54_BRAFL|nr:serine/threonine-protein kinase Nek7-like [Branchiostoma floridae]
MVNRVNRKHEEIVRPVIGRRCSLDIDDRLTRDWFVELVMKIKRIFGLPTDLTLDYTSLSQLSTMSQDAIFYTIAESKLARPHKLLDYFESNLQAMKEVDKRIMEDLFEMTRSQLDLATIYEPQASEITKQLGRLTMVELEQMRKYEFDLDGIPDWHNPQNRIGGGSYGEVYRVHVERGGVNVRAALKIGVLPNDLTTEFNAWDFLTEENNLRKLTGAHIVEYYGTACKKEERGLRLGLVMELCEGTLMDRIVGQREHNPTWWHLDAAMQQRAFSYIQDKAIQLCEGLRTIHDSGYIHRDLKLINVLVTAGGVVKLTDVGETKRAEHITGTITGTAIYAAPEVKGRKVYGTSADIYSLGLILWEMWYGRTIADAMNDPSLKGLTDGESIIMPHCPSDHIRPIPEWTTLVRDCMNKDPNKRPTALECLTSIRAMAVEDNLRFLMYQTTRL